MNIQRAVIVTLTIKKMSVLFSENDSVCCIDLPSKGTRDE